MDFFGIGTALKTATNIYFQVARRTGRTTMLLDHLKNGDRVIFLDGKTSAHFEYLLRDKKLKVKCITMNPAHIDLGRLPPIKGNTIFSHEWVEEYFKYKLDRCIADIDEIQKITSSHKAQPIESPMMIRPPHGIMVQQYKDEIEKGKQATRHFRKKYHECKSKLDESLEENKTLYGARFSDTETAELIEKLRADLQSLEADKSHNSVLINKYHREIKECMKTIDKERSMYSDLRIKYNNIVSTIKNKFQDIKKQP